MKNALNASSCCSRVADPRFYSHESQHEACGEESFQVTSQCRTTGPYACSVERLPGAAFSESEPSTQLCQSTSKRIPGAFANMRAPLLDIKRAEAAIVLALKMKKQLLMFGTQV